MLAWPRLSRSARNSANGCLFHAKLLQILVNARGLQRSEVLFPMLHADDRPRVSPRRQHRVHQESGNPSVALTMWVNVTKQPMSRHCAQGGMRLRLQKRKQGVHCVRQNLATRRHMLKVPIPCPNLLNQLMRDPVSLNGKRMVTRGCCRCLSASPIPMRRERNRCGSAMVASGPLERFSASRIT